MSPRIQSSAMQSGPVQAAPMLSVSTPLVSLFPDGLQCVVFLDPGSVSRNRFFSVYADPKARRAHARAHALRRLFRRIIGMIVDGRCPEVVAQDSGLRIGYRDDGLSLVRTVHLGVLDASLFRVLLGIELRHRGFSQILPACLRETEGDRACVIASLDTVLGLLGLPRAVDWLDALGKRHVDVRSMAEYQECRHPCVSSAR